MKTVIIDCGGGNLRSVKNALYYLGIASEITGDRNKIENADRVIFPGQGNFGTVMQQLDQANLKETLRFCALNRPFLGICVGMQLLLEASEEAPGIPGLGIFSGKVKKFPSTFKTPQMGWNKVEFAQSSAYFYFANSYYCNVEDSSVVCATTHYGVNFPSALRRGQLLAAQFHPEKSGEAGLRFLESFVRNT